MTGGAGGLREGLGGWVSRPLERNGGGGKGTGPTWLLLLLLVVMVVGVVGLVCES